LTAFVEVETLTKAEVNIRVRWKPDFAVWSAKTGGTFYALFAAQIALFLTIGLATITAGGREKDKAHYGEGLIVNIPLPEAEVAPVVQEVAQNGIIRGTKEYNKDEFVEGAIIQSQAKGFTTAPDGDRVFYKVRAHAIDPRNFKDGGDSGSLAVRYLLQAQGEHNTLLRIDAVFVEDFKRAVHQSDGSVESAEYKDIHDHLDAIELMKTQTAEAERERQDLLVKKQQAAMNVESAKIEDVRPVAAPAAVPASPSEQRPDPDPPVVSADAASSPAIAKTVEDRVRELRRQVERVVKSPGAPLKSAPFHSASTLASLTPGTEVMIMILTPYWVGVETHGGQHGWILRDELEQAP
jgi:hypothetical protein